MRLMVATSNPHKLLEIRAVLKSLGVTVLGLSNLQSTAIAPEEEADTFEGNARLKAVGYSRQIGMPCLAEDSGLEVDALDGEPGVYSARYAGVGKTREERDEANNELLLERLESVPDDERNARFVCAMCLVDRHAQVLFETVGTFEGTIVREPKGSNGFGYDPLLFLPDLGKTSAELTAREKNKRSHRGQATLDLAEWLREHGSGTLAG